MPFDTATIDPVLETVESLLSADEFCQRLKALMQREPIYVGSVKDDEFHITLSENLERYSCVAIRGEIAHDGGNNCKILLYKATPADLIYTFKLQLVMLVFALGALTFLSIYNNGELVGSVYIALLGFFGLIGLLTIQYVQMTKQSSANLRRKLIDRVRQCADYRQEIADYRQEIAD